MQFEAWRVIESAGFAARPSAANLLSEPVLVCKASGTCVVRLESQRGPGGRKQMQA
jgi:3-aminobutyryl-CoA ammonia-lyase